MANTNVSCSRCKHFYITWDPTAPKGCRAYKIKSAQLPSLIVAQASSHGCLAFEDKALLQNPKNKLDLNNKDLW